MHLSNAQRLKLRIYNIPNQPLFKTWHGFVGNGFGTLIDANCTKIIRLWRNKVYYDLYDQNAPGELFYLIECTERYGNENKIIVTNNGKYAEIYSLYNCADGMSYEVKPTIKILTADDQKIINKAIRKYRKSINH